MSFHFLIFFITILMIIIFGFLLFNTTYICQNINSPFRIVIFSYRNNLFFYKKFLMEFIMLHSLINISGVFIFCLKYGNGREEENFVFFSVQKKFNFIGGLFNYPRTRYLLQLGIKSCLHNWKEKLIANGNISQILITHFTSQKQIQNEERNDDETRIQSFACSSSGTVYGKPSQNMFYSFGNKIPNKWNNPISECICDNI